MQNLTTIIKMKRKKITIDVELDALHLKEIPDALSVDLCEGMFDVSENRLTSLKNCPRVVLGNFLCGNNNLTSLEGGPTEVRGNYVAYNNKLTSLKGIATHLRYSLKLENNQLTSLDGIPRMASNTILELGTNLLKSLEGYGFEDIVFNSFSVPVNKLTTLVGGPKRVSDYDCSVNPIKNLVGAPIEVTNNFYCTNLPTLESLNGLPKIIAKNIFISEDDLHRLYPHLSRNGLKEQVRGMCKVGGQVWLSD